MKKFLCLSTLCFAFLIKASDVQTSSGHLDSEYSKEFTDVIELVYGLAWLSQGGSNAVDYMFSGQDLEEKKLLDVGSGLGGIDFYLAEKYGASITGIDCVKRLVDDANCRIADHQLKGDVFFMHQDENNFHYPFQDNSFDIVFSKESFLHVVDKQSLLQELFRVVKPGGSIIILDWLVPSADLGPRITKMMEMDGLDLSMATFEEYEKALNCAGFNTIFLLCTNEKYIGYTQDNIDRIQAYKEIFIKNFGEEIYEYAVQSWSLQKSIFENQEVLVTLIQAKK